MRIWILSFSIGVLAGGFIPVLPEFYIALLLWLPLLCSWWWRSLSLAAAFCLGLWWLLFQANAHQQAILPRALEQQDIWVSGTVEGLPQQHERSSRLVFRSESWCSGPGPDACEGHGLWRKQKLLLNDYDSRYYLPGERWLLQVRLKRPHGFANPGGFDYERWLFQEGITATGYIRAAIHQEKDRISLADRLDRFRLRFREFLEIVPLESRGFIAALTIGDRYGISDRQWQLLTLTGTNHLMVISGLHIGLVAWMAYHVASYLFRCIPSLATKLPVPRLAAMAAMLAAFCYSGLAGFSLPVQRALVMVCCLMSGQVLVRQTNPVNNLCLALLLVLLLDPLAPQSAGFWLSFLAVALLLLGLTRQGGEPGPAGAVRLLQAQYRLFFGLAPVMLLLFRQVSLLAPAVNLVAIPLIGTVVVPLCLLGFVASLVAPGIAARLVSVADFLLVNYEQWLSVLTGRLHFLLVKFPALPGWLLALLGMVLLWHLARPRGGTWLALGMVLVLCLAYTPGRPRQGEFILDVLDVGQGLAVVITTRGHQVLYDTGPVYSPRFNAGSGIVQPFIESNNLGAPDLQIVSHGDSDHAGGFGALRMAYPDTAILAGEALQGLATTEICRAGRSWLWDGIHFTFLHPASTTLEGNNASCVMKVSAGDYSVLLPGDIERDVELALVREYGENLEAQVLVAPHHGSASSSTPPFLRRVNAGHVVVTAGYLNRFGHPHPIIMERYRRQGSQVHHTAASGAIRFRVSINEGITGPEYFRETRPRFWAAGR